MAVEGVMLELFRQLRARRAGQPLRVLSAGYPDILVDAASLGRLFGADILPKLSFRADGAQIAGWHGLAGKLDQVVDADSLFTALDCHLDVIDVAKIRGNELLADLNVPLPADFPGGYDIVLDSGTCEHVFNAGQAVINLASRVAVGGWIVQAAPLNSYNHGFYNFSPTLFHDFYDEPRGFRLQFLKGFSNLVHNPRSFDVQLVNRFRGAPENSILIAVAERVADRPLKPPVQHKYKQFIGSENP